MFLHFVESRPLDDCTPFHIMGRDPVELGNERNINHPLCGCAVYVIQKNHRSIYNEVVQAEIINERKGDFNGK